MTAAFGSALDKKYAKDRLQREEQRLRAIERGNRAKEFMEDPAIAAAFQGLREYLDSELISVSSQEAAFRVAMQHQALRLIQGALQAMIATGVSASDAIRAEDEKLRMSQRTSEDLQRRARLAREARAEIDAIQFNREGATA